MKSIALRTEHRQQQTLTPRLQQAVRLLQLSSLDFAQEIHAALDKNPFLEAVDDEDGDVSALACLATRTELPDERGDTDAAPAAVPDSADKDAVGSDSPDESSAPGDDYEPEDWQSSGSGNRQGGDGESSVLDMMAADVGLRHHLHTQLNVMHLSERELILAKVVVESLDDDGYLRDSLEDLCAICDFKPAPTLKEMERALACVQSLDPAGVGARTVAEALMLQTPQIECAEERMLAQRIVSQHLDRLVKHDTHGLARELNCSPELVEAVCNSIRRLDPRPGWRHGGSSVQYITPDVIVRKVRGEWTVSLSTSIVPRVKLNQMYADLFQRHRQGQHTELAAHLQEARWTIRNVEQRFSTILQVSEAIIRRQKNFLEYGALAMRPLALKEIAEEVGLHESTVSRVTNNKYMTTPVGVFELKYFFSRAMPTASGGTCSATAIRGVIQTMIDQERAHEPLSDAEIARRLARQGLTVARRTVTKYRQAMRIAPVEHRRRLE